jgi:hypothetical protein
VWPKRSAKKELKKLRSPKSPSCIYKLVHVRASRARLDGAKVRNSHCDLLDSIPWVVTSLEEILDDA